MAGPNARLNRRQQDAFVSRELLAAGFEIPDAKGMNYARPIATRAGFSEDADVCPEPLAR